MEDGSPVAGFVAPPREVFEEIQEKGNLLKCVQQKSAFVMCNKDSDITLPQVNVMLGSVDASAFETKTWIEGGDGVRLGLMHARNDKGAAAEMGFVFGIVVKRE
jgi:hypothetical protein